MGQIILTNKIRDAVIRELGIGADDLSAEVTRYQNQVLREIAQYYPWDWMESVPVTLSTDSGQSYITKPAYMGDIKAIYQDEGGVEITRKSEAEYARLMSLSDTTNAKALHFIEQGGRILFWPPLVAASSVVILCAINAEQFTDDADTGVNEALAEITPSSFSLVLEYGILRCLDILEKKKSWTDLYYAELETKRGRAIMADAPKVKAVLGPTIDGMNRHFSTR